MESISIYNGEIEHNLIYRNNREFLIVGGVLGADKMKQSIYWTIDSAVPFLEKLDEMIVKEPPANYLKIMETIWNDHKKTLNRMEEKFIAMKKEKENAKNGILESPKEKEIKDKVQENNSEKEENK